MSHFSGSPLDPSILFSTFGVVFLAELGDKTQLTAIALAARFPWKRAFVGIASAFAVLNAGAVLIGTLLFELIPVGYLQAASAVLFLAFGVLTLRGNEDGGRDDTSERANRGPVATSFALIFMAELGDKTQLVTASLAAQHARPWAVFTGSTLALWLVSLLGLLVGAQLAKRVPLIWVHRAAGAAFLLFGLAAAVHAARSFGFALK